MTGFIGALAIVATWAVMFLVLRARHVRLRRPTVTRRRSSRLGLLLQVVAYLGVFFVRYQWAPPFEGGWGLPVIVAALAGVTVSIAGAVLVVWSQQTLDVQWSLTARLIEGHRLITTGPYAFVRHPVYAAMILMLIGTGMALTTPLVVAAALVVYVAGTLVRIRAEETLMHQAFGAEWEAYRRRVRALIPGVL